MTVHAPPKSDAFFTGSLADSDPALAGIVGRELKRQQEQIELIASENIVSRAVLEAQGSVLTNKYAEGYPGKRYYGGCEVVDEAESLAIERAKQLFGCQYANVQPHSGSQANQAVFMATMVPGDTFMGMNLDHGGHLTHGKSVNQSGKWFRPVAYGVRAQDHTIDYDQAEEVALAEKPKVIIAGATAYSRVIDFARFRAIAAEARRQEDHVELIASENYASPRVMEAQGSVLTNKYAEGYPGRRYYGGCEYVDVAESLALERLKALYDCDYANVQPHSG